MYGNARDTISVQYYIEIAFRSLTQGRSTLYMLWRTTDLGCNTIARRNTVKRNVFTYGWILCARTGSIRWTPVLIRHARSRDLDMANGIQMRLSIVNTHISCKCFHFLLFFFFLTGNITPHFWHSYIRKLRCADRVAVALYLDSQTELVKWERCWVVEG